MSRRIVSAVLLTTADGRGLSASAASFAACRGAVEKNPTSSSKRYTVRQLQCQAATPTTPGTVETGSELRPSRVKPCSVITLYVSPSRLVSVAMVSLSMAYEEVHSDQFLSRRVQSSPVCK